MIVDDDRNLLELIKMRLESANYDVTAACEEEKALAALKAQPFDLCILDLMLANGRLMDLVQIRAQDMTSLIDAGEPVPDQVRLRLEQHIQDALQICLTLDEPTLDRTLLQIRDRLQDRDREMERLLLHTQEQLQLQKQDQLRIQLQDQLQLLTQTRTMLRERLHVVEDGLLNHEMFRERVQNG